MATAVAEGGAGATVGLPDLRDVFGRRFAPLADLFSTVFVAEGRINLYGRNLRVDSKTETSQNK